MEGLSPEFLSTVAQVSATLIGFAVLTSVFQALASGRILIGEQYIKKKNLLVKLIGLALFPIFILGYPLVFSLFLLSLSSTRNITESHLLLNVAVTIFCLHYFRKIRKYSKLRGIGESHKLTSFKLFAFFVTWIPMILLLIILIYSALLFFTELISLLYIFPPLTFILFIASGFLLILQNLGIKIDTGILFESKDVEVNKINQMLEEFKNEVNKAINDRKNLIRKMTERVKLEDKEERKKELIRSIAEHEAEINLLKNFIFEEFFKEKKVEKVKKLCKGSAYNVTLGDLSDFLSWMKEAKRVHWEFKRGTMRNEIIFNLLYGGELYVQKNDAKEKRNKNSLW